MLLRWMLSKLIRIGSLTVLRDATSFTVEGTEPGPSVTIRVKDRATEARLAIHPDLYLGEAYMDGDLTIENGGTIWDLLDLCGQNIGTGSTWMQKAVDPIFRRIYQLNAKQASRRNVAHHYDLSGEMYRSFLDADMQYSCAYFADPRMTIDEAQTAKKAHIAAKLALEPGHRVLDIGCGWGGTALFLAQAEDVEVHGITLSREQLSVCQSRAAALGLQDRVTFSLTDYRDVMGPYDRIVSVGMFEHVGAPQYETFFDTVSKLLTPSGVAVLHSIGRAAGPSSTSAWMRKYIFPGGYAPAVSEIMPIVEHSGLWLTDLEILRMHYAETLKAWRERFLASVAARGLPPGYDERFYRMWDFYLAASEMSFRHCGFMVFQAQLARDPHALPLTRDYMFERERTLIPPTMAPRDPWKDAPVPVAVEKEAAE